MSDLGYESMLNEAEGRLDGQLFRTIKRHGDPPERCLAAIEGLSADIEAACRVRDGSVDWELVSEQSYAFSGVGKFLRRILGRVCLRADRVTCIIEPDHIDDVYSDLVSQIYMREHFEVRKRTMRLSIFAEALDEETYFLRPGRIEPWEAFSARQANGVGYPPLQRRYVGSVVIEPRFVPTIGRTLLDPRWVGDADVDVRLSDFDVTVRGKRLQVSAFPWRAQDGEALSCAETSILNLVTYYANEYDDYGLMLPGKVLERIAERVQGRVTPSQGLDFGTVGSVLSSVGFSPRKYARDDMAGRGVLGELGDSSDRLRKVARAYVDSGIPVAVNLQGRGRKVGHSVLLVGLGAERMDGWETSAAFAERIEKAEDEDGPAGSVQLMDVADLESYRGFCVIDDSAYPYRISDWNELSVYHNMEADELMVPTATQMALGAMEAHDRAGEILRSPRYGMLAMAPTGFEADARLVLTQQMVSVRSYLRFRVGTCDPDVASVWELGAFPRYAWLFECLEYDQWQRPAVGRRAVAELLLDATSAPRADPTSGIVLMRYPGVIHYHAADGSGVTMHTGAAQREFVAYDRNLRHVTAKRVLH